MHVLTPGYPSFSRGMHKSCKVMMCEPSDQNAGIVSRLDFPAVYMAQCLVRDK